MEVQPESWGDYLPSNRTIQFLIFPLCAQKNLKIKYCTIYQKPIIYQKPTRNGNSMLLLHGSPLAEKKKKYYAQTTVYMDEKNDGILKKNGLS